MKELQVKLVCSYKEECNSKLSGECVGQCAFCKIKQQ